MAINIIYTPRPNPVSSFANCALLLKVENENHCDFTKLREMLIRTNMEDLCDSTHSRHYELYRKERLKQMGFEEGDKEGKASSFAETYTMRRESHLQSLQEREEEMRQKFVLRVKEKEAELKEQRRNCTPSLTR